MVWESGAYDASSGVLVHDAALKLYRAEPGIWNRHGTGACDTADALGSPVFHFARNDCIAVDNRIPAAIAIPSDPETLRGGLHYPETAPGSGSS